MATTAVVRANPFVATNGAVSRNGRTVVVAGYSSRDKGRTGSVTLSRVHRSRAGTIRIRTTTVRRVATSKSQANADLMAVHRKAQPTAGQLKKAGYRQVRTGNGRGIILNRRTTYSTYKKTRSVGRKSTPPQLSRAQRQAIAGRRRRDSKGKFN